MIGFLRRANKKPVKQRGTGGPGKAPVPSDFIEISKRLEDNEAYLRREFANITDIVFREFYVGKNRCLAVWFKGMIDNRVSRDLFHSLMLDLPPEDLREVPGRELADYLNKHFLPFYSTARVTDLAEIKRWVLMAKLVMLIDGCPVGLMLEAEHTPTRNVSEPVVESTVAGPRDGFVESLLVNTALIRKRLGDAKLKSENFILGRRSNTLVTLMYIEELANPKILEEVRQRINRIDIDSLSDSSYLKELIQDRRFSLFPLMKNTERPDRVVADLLEGRFALIVNGTPQVLTAPTLFVEFLQTSDDYYLNPTVAWMIRILRYLALNIAAGLPAIYIALTTYHQEMIPIPLIFTIAGARETVPFPAYFDALFLLLIFELLWESSIRLPRVVGAAINIVGALVLGQAAIQAGLVSPFLVIVIAATVISNFSLGSGYELASGLRLIRIVFMTAAAVLGFYGISLIYLALLVHLTGLRSFGVPYLEPWAPSRWRELKDTVYRAPRWGVTERPALIAGEDLTRSAAPGPSPPPAGSRRSGSGKDSPPSKKGGEGNKWNRAK